MNASIEIREYRLGDSLQEITDLLHRAYADLGERGMNFVATDQTVEVTESRISAGRCFLALVSGRIVGTIALYGPVDSDGCEWYKRDGVFHFGQYGVEPRLQGAGIGKALLTAAEREARLAGATELALDTSERATDLIQLYQRWGFRLVEEIQWEGRNYRSFVLSKSLES